MKVDGESVPRRSNGELPENATDFPPVIASMQGDMGQHFLAGHIAFVAIGEVKGHGLREDRRRDRAEVFKIPPVGGGDGGSQLMECWSFVQIIRREAMRDALQMAGEYPRNHIIMADQPENDFQLCPVRLGANAFQFVEQIGVGPGVVAEEYLERSAHCHPILSRVRNVSKSHILYEATLLSTRIAKQRSVMRKEPKQARSRATVETIVQAGARILSDEGWAGFTTNRIAELAGVSIGSFYQYFPNKLALVDAIRHHHLDDSMAVMRSIRADGLSPAEFAAQLVRAVVAAHSVYPGLHRVLLDEAPSSEEYRNPHSEFEIEYLFYYAQAVATYRKRLPNEADRIAGRVISDAIDGVIHNAARRGCIDNPVVQNELVCLVSLYLSGDGATEKTF